MGFDACGILSRSVGQTNRKLKYGGHSAYKMQKSTEKIAKSPTIVGRLYYTVWSKSAVGNESVPKIIINDTINIFLKSAISISYSRL